MNYVIGIIIAIIIALIVVSVMKSGLTSVAAQRQADNYVIKGSVNIRNTFDTFERKTLEKREKPKQAEQNK